MPETRLGCWGCYYRRDPCECDCGSVWSWKHKDLPASLGLCSLAKERRPGHPGGFVTHPLEAVDLSGSILMSGTLARGA